MKLGSLFSGFGGLDLAIEHVFGAETVWVSDIEPGPCKVLAHRWPGVPNLGDITKIDWATVEPVDIIAGGSPCQDISSAGRMAGMREGTRSNLWVEMRQAIRHLQPMFVVWENVQAARYTKAASRCWPDHIDQAIAYHLAVSKGINHDRAAISRHRRAAHRLMELRARCVGVPYPKPALRALGRVLGDLADLGYDTVWVSVPASGVGAPHLRRRYFVFAANTAGQQWLVTNAQNFRHQRGGETRGRGTGSSNRSDGAIDSETQLPTPTAQDGANTAGASQLERHSLPLNTVVTLLPTPSAGNFNDGEDPESWEQRRQRVAATADNGNGMGMPLGIAVKLLPTPRATDGTKGGPNQRGSSGDLILPSAVAMLPTPRATRGGSTTEISYALGGERSDEDRPQGRVLLPTPQAHDAVGGKTPEQVAAMRARGHGVSNLNEVDFGNLLPTPSVADSMGGHQRRGGDRSDELLLKGIAAQEAWGRWQPAIERWEAINGPAPAPTKLGSFGQPKLNPAFAEWMMGAAPGWITDVPGVTDNEALRMVGNGVVQQQAEEALRWCIERFLDVLDIGGAA